MPDPYERLPQDDESPDALLTDFQEYLAAQVPGWAPSDAALEVAIGAACADEGSTLYSLVREDADDKFRDFGATFLSTPSAEPAAAATTTTWTARTVAGTDGYTIEAGTTLVIQAPTGDFAFEVVQDATITSGNTTVAGVLVRSLDPGAAANNATGPVLFDEPPAWIQSVAVEAPAFGGNDGDTDEEHATKVRAALQLLSRAPILPADFEKVAQEVDECARALVLNLYDDDTGLDDQERTVSLYPITAQGLPCSSDTKSAIAQKILARREVNWVCRVADPDYTTVNLTLTVAAAEGADHADVKARVEAAIAAGPLSPALWGQPDLGERLTWQKRSTVRRYEISAAARQVEGVAYVVTVSISGADGLGNLALTGPAPLPQAGTIVATVVDPA
jgi:hypothetical protein